MILVYAAQALPVSIWMLRNFVATVPKELEEAAAIDGASAPRTFWRILFPLVAPGLVATSIVATAGGRPLLIVVRDAHRYPVARAGSPRAAREQALRDRRGDGLADLASPNCLISRYIWCYTCQQPGRGGTPRPRS